MKKMLIFISLLFIVGCSSNNEPVPTATPEATIALPVHPTPVVLDNEEIELEVLKTGTITNGEHKVSAVINLYNNGTLELTDFNYDGRAPDVYVAFGTIEDGKFVYEGLLGDKITTALENETLTIQVDQNIDIKAISIWCHQFTEDFGSTTMN